MTDKGANLDLISCLMFTGFAPAHPPRRTYDNPDSTARRKMGTSDGNRTHISRTESRRSLAVELRGHQMDKWRDRAEAFHAGNRTRTAKAFATDGTPSFVLVDNRSSSAHRNLQKLKKHQKRRKTLPECFRSSTAERRSLKSWLWVQLPSEAPEFDESRISATMLAMT